MRRSSAAARAAIRRRRRARCTARSSPSTCSSSSRSTASTSSPGDFREPECWPRSKPGRRQAGRRRLSDMAPNLSGVAASDAARMEDLVELAIDFARRHLRPMAPLSARCFTAAATVSSSNDSRRGFGPSNRSNPRRRGRSRPRPLSSESASSRPHPESISGRSGHMPRAMTPAPGLRGLKSAADAVSRAQALPGPVLP